MPESQIIEISRKKNKSLTVAETIAEKILNGELKSGACLETVRVLGKRFAVSISVIQAALRELEDRELIERKAYGAALVCDRSSPVRNVRKQVLLCLRSTGHVFENVAAAISGGLISRGMLPVSVDFTKVNGHVPEPKFKENIGKILDSGPKSIILSGDTYWRYPFLENHPNVRAVFLYVLDYAGPTPERAVLLDQETALHQTTAHLASLGYKKIMLCTFRPEPHAINLETAQRHQAIQIKSGYERALREYNIASYERTFYRDGGVNTRELIEILRSKDAPEAIVCDMDRTAMQVEMTALKIGMKVPGDLAVTGAFNTPWSELCPVPLTTVEYDWNELSEKAIALALEDEPEQKIYYLKPQLIVKNSTGKEP